MNRADIADVTHQRLVECLALSSFDLIKKRAAACVYVCFIVIKESAKIVEKTVTKTAIKLKHSLLSVAMTSTKTLLLLLLLFYVLLYCIFPKNLDKIIFVKTIVHYITTIISYFKQKQNIKINYISNAYLFLIIGLKIQNQERFIKTKAWKNRLQN